MIAYYKKVINWQQFNDDRSGRNVIIISFINSLSGGHRKPLGSRRRQLEWMTNFILLVVSLFGVTVGAGLLGFYKIHLLTFLSVEFLVLPMVLLGMRIQLNYRTFHNIINLFSVQFIIETMVFLFYRRRVVHIICVDDWFSCHLKTQSLSATFLCLYVISSISGAAWGHNMLGEGIFI